jgi:hypothetical protein
MRGFLRRCRGVVGMGLTWAVAWSALFFTLGVVIGIFDPDSIDPGEEPILIARIGALIGFVAGAGFGLLISLAEARKKLVHLSLMRAGLWGAIASSALPLLTAANDNMIILMAPIGAILGVTSVGVARRAEARRRARTSAIHAWRRTPTERNRH